MEKRMFVLKGDYPFVQEPILGAKIVTIPKGTPFFGPSKHIQSGIEVYISDNVQSCNDVKFTFDKNFVEGNGDWFEERKLTIASKSKEQLDTDDEITEEKLKELGFIRDSDLPYTRIYTLKNYEDTGLYLRINTEEAIIAKDKDKSRNYSGRVIEKTTSLNVVKSIFFEINTIIAKIPEKDRNEVENFLKFGGELKLEKKPPLGVMPRILWEEQRMTDIYNAMERYKEAGFPIREEWQEEYNFLYHRKSFEDSFKEFKKTVQKYIPNEEKSVFVTSMDFISNYFAREERVIYREDAEKERIERIKKDIRKCQEYLSDVAKDPELITKIQNNLFLEMDYLTKRKEYEKGIGILRDTISENCAGPDNFMEIEKKGIFVYASEFIKEHSPYIIKRDWKARVMPCNTEKGALPTAESTMFMYKRLKNTVIKYLLGESFVPSEFQPYISDSQIYEYAAAFIEEKSTRDGVLKSRISDELNLLKITILRIESSLC